MDGFWFLVSLAQVFSLVFLSLCWLSGQLASGPGFCRLQHSLSVDWFIIWLVIFWSYWYFCTSSFVSVLLCIILYLLEQIIKDYYYLHYTLPDPRTFS